MPEPVYEGPEDPVPAEEAEVLDPSTSFIDNTAEGPQIAAPGQPELADAEETLAGAPNAPVAAPAPQAAPGTVVNPPATPAAAGAGAFAATQEGIDALKAKAAAGQELDDNERDRLAAAAQDERDIQVQRELEAQAQKDARDEFMAKKNAADEKVRDYKFHDYFDDPAHGSKALARWAVFLGGLGNLGGQAPGAPNRALDSLETNIRADHDQQLAYLNSAKYFADKQAEGVTDLLKQQQSDRQQAELEYANKKLATADKFAELAQTARGKINQAAADVEIAKLRKSGYDDQGKVQAEIAKQHLEDLQGQAALARAQRYAHKGGGGVGGNADNFAAFEAAAQAIPPGASVPKEVYALAFKAGFKTKDVQAEVDKARESGKKSLPGGKPPAAPGTLDKNTVVYGGKPLGLAPSGRGGAAAFTQSLITYDDAVESLEALKKRAEAGGIGRVPRGDAYNRAVLAIAATTTANPSDSTTKHEADTLKGLLTIDPKAIQTSIDHIKERRKAKIGTLLPLPGGAVEISPQAAKVLDQLKSLGFQ